MANFNINTNLDYRGPRGFHEVMTEINVHLPKVTSAYPINAQPGCKVQDLITNFEKSMVSERAEISSLNGRITKIEYDSSNPTLGSMAGRVARTAALVLAYIVLAATIIGLFVITLLECECDAFARASKDYSPQQLQNDKQRLSGLHHQLKTEEDNVAGLNELKAKAPAAIQTLEQRIALLKQTEADIIANASTNHLWHALVGNNSRVLHQYETALFWFQQAVVAA